MIHSKSMFKTKLLYQLCLTREAQTCGSRIPDRGCYFVEEEEKSLNPRKYTQNKDDNHQGTQPGIRIWTTFVGGELSNHCPSLHSHLSNSWISLSLTVRMLFCWLNIFSVLDWVNLITLFFPFSGLNSVFFLRGPRCVRSLTSRTLANILSLIYGAQLLMW